MASCRPPKMAMFNRLELGELEEGGLMAKRSEIGNFGRAGWQRTAL